MARFTLERKKKDSPNLTVKRASIQSSVLGTICGHNQRVLLLNETFHKPLLKMLDLCIGGNFISVLRKCTASKPTAIDIFCGAGGLTTGLKQAGFNVVGAIDIDDLAVETYKVNHPDVYVWQKNIRNLTVKSVLKTLKLRKGEINLLAGCPPCQGFSSMRTLNGSKKIEDKRNDLIYDFLRFVRVLRPKTIMLENVPGLIRDQRFTYFCTVLDSLGYSYSYKIQDAAKFSVPQRRKRLILMGGRFGSPPFPTESKSKRTVKDAIYKLKSNPKDLLSDTSSRRSSKISKLLALIPKNGGSRLDLPLSKQLDCHMRCNGFKDVYGRMSLNDVSPTITSGCFNPSKGRFLHPTRNRVITLREAAVLQTFPLSYHFSMRRGKSGAARLIGNALPPEFIRQHSKMVLRYLQERRWDHARPSDSIRA